MQAFTTLPQMLAQHAAESVCLTAPSTPPLTYGALADLCQRTLAALNAAGLGRADRVALVMPNCPEMAAAFVAVASACTAAPLNPAYRADEFEFTLSDLHARAVIVLHDSDSPVTAVATRLGIHVFRLQPMPHNGAGDFSLNCDPSLGRPLAAGLGPAQANDIALILHTSGTTSRPKIVPLSHANLCASARNISHTLRLSHQDRGLHVMPLFHIHGLIAGVLAPLAAGGQVFCTPGFNALRFFAWMKEANPTWYTAVPTMHQTILARASGSRDVIAAHPLRFIRSSSSPMPSQVIAEIERVFGAPLVESYGMTEAAHQMTSSPLPPARRIAGSVGLAAGPQIAIMNQDAQLQPPGVIGEVVIRGDNVTSGYENNPAANAQAFVNGWFRTGDQGVLDSEGYLTLTGRLKEIINRGGEKISPREVDEVLMDHPAVAQVVTFAIPHDKLGEEVAAAVVLRDGQVLTERELRDFASTRLADFKVPKKMLFMAEIPKGATGKLQRIGLAAKLGLAPS